MSIEKTAVTIEEARRRAQKVVRFELGTFVRIGQGHYDSDENEFQFPITIRSPKIIADDQRDNVMDVRYYPEKDLGVIKIDGRSGDVERPNRRTIRRMVREYEEEIEIAVQKALVSAAGRKFSHLPFPENQFSPLEDILSELILNGEMDMEQIEMMDDGRDNSRYQEYVDALVDLDLAEVQQGIITNGGVLINIVKEVKSDPEKNYRNGLNAAMGRYFEDNLGEFEMIKRTLGPYLAIAGRYYRRALELEEMPVVHEDELRDAIQDEYTGSKRERKLMKLSRYLIQLEGVGILESVDQNGTRLWTGDQEVRDDLLDQKKYLGHYQSLLAPAEQ